MSVRGSAGPTCGSPSSKAIDRSVLGEWVDGDDGAIDAMLVIFSESVCLEQNRMRAALEDNDLEQHARCAHRLRGAAMAMGAHALAGTSSILEKAARAGELSRCVTTMRELEKRIHQVMEEIPQPV